MAVGLVFFMLFSSWQFLAVFAVVFFSIATVVDKNFVSGKAQARVALAFIGASSLLAFIAAALFFGITIPALPALALGLVTGLAWLCAIVAYYQSLKIGEVSRMAPIFQLAPLFTALLAAGVLAEELTALNYLGVALVIAGAALVSVEKVSNKRVGRGVCLGKGALLALVSAGLFALHNVLLKQSVSELGAASAFIWLQAAVAAACAIIAVVYRGDVRKFISAHPRSVAIVLASNSGRCLAGLAFAVAAGLSQITLVATVVATQPFLILVIALALSKIKPSLLKEKFDRKSLALKAAAAVLVVVGSWLVMA